MNKLNPADISRFQILCLAEIVKYCYAAVCLLHIIRKWWHREDAEHDQLCLFGEEACAVWRHYGAWLRSSCWNVGGTERQTCVQVQPTQFNKYHNHLSHSEYCNTTFPQNWQQHAWNLISVGVSCLVLLIADSIFAGFSTHTAERQDVKKKTAHRKHSCENVVLTMEINQTCLWVLY